ELGCFQLTNRVWPLPAIWNRHASLARVRAAGSGRDYPPMGRSSAQPLEVRVGDGGDLADGLLPLPLLPQVSRHDAQNERAVLGKDNTRVVSHPFKRPRLVSDADAVGQPAQEGAVLVSTQNLEEVFGRRLAQDFSVVNRL